eukprot:11361382-Prorocentrum_lima.AAC.1
MVAPRAATSTHSMAATQALFVGSLFVCYFDLGGSKRTQLLHWRLGRALVWLMCETSVMGHGYWN